MKASERIRRALIVQLSAKHPDIWKGYDAGTQENGWHFREFGRSDAQYLGKSLTEAMETIEAQHEERRESMRDLA